MKHLAWSPSVRRRVVVLACALAALLVPAHARAQDVFRSVITAGAGPILPITGRDAFQDAGSSYTLGIGVGDDFSTVGFRVGYSAFGGGPFERAGIGVTHFELRGDVVPRAPRALSPYGRITAGAYEVDTDRAASGSKSRRFGGSVGAGVRWAPQWQSSFTLVASYYNMPARREPPSQWVTVSLEFSRWMD